LFRRDACLSGSVPGNMPFPWSWVRSPDRGNNPRGSQKLDDRAALSLTDVRPERDPKDSLRKDTAASRRRQKAQTESERPGVRDSCDDRDGRRPDSPSPSGRWLPSRTSWKVRAAWTGESPLLPECEQKTRLDLHFEDKYVTREVIGVGAFSQVSLVSRVGEEAGENLACKTLRMSKRLDEPKTIEISSIEQVRNEVAVLKQLDHPNVPKLVDVFIGPDTCRLVMPILRGGDLLEALRFRGSFAEEDARTIMASILSALKHIHSLGIAHRDLKLENLLLAEPHDLSRVVLIDYGLAKTMRDDPFGSACGTPMYVAPEVVTNVDNRTGLSRYGCEVDIWSAGVVLFMLLSGSPPFLATSVLELLKEVRCGRVFVDDPVWHMVSDEAKDLLRGLLTVDPTKRISIDAALAHPWFAL